MNELKVNKHIVESQKLYLYYFNEAINMMPEFNAYTGLYLLFKLEKNVYDSIISRHGSDKTDLTNMCIFDISNNYTLWSLIFHDVFLELHKYELYKNIDDLKLLNFSKYELQILDDMYKLTKMINEKKKELHDFDNIMTLIDEIVEKTIDECNDFELLKMKNKQYETIKLIESKLNKGEPIA